MSEKDDGTFAYQSAKKLLKLQEEASTKTLKDKSFVAFVAPKNSFIPSLPVTVVKLSDVEGLVAELIKRRDEAQVSHDNWWTEKRETRLKTLNEVLVLLGAKETKK